MRGRFDHRFTLSNLSPYLDGRLTERQKRRLERHLAACPACRQELSELRGTVQLLGQVPLRPVPRSFALPASVQPQQARYRRWNTAYSLLRGATAAAAFVFLLLVSGDALLGALPGALSSPGEALREQAVSERAASPAFEAKEVARVVTVVVEAEKAVEEEGVIRAAPAEDQDAEARPAAKEAPVSGGSLEPPAKGLDRGEEPESPPTPQPRMLRVGTERAPAAVGGGTEDLAKATPSGAPEHERATATVGPTAVPTTAPTAVPSRTSAPATPVPSPTPARVAEHTMEETRLIVEPIEAPVPLPPSPLWGLWRAVRVLSGLVGGFLLILLAGLIWAGHKRRI